jgi:hypothetical protein
VKRHFLSPPYSQGWTEALKVHPDLPVDLIGSLREEAINHILEKHFQFDNARYTFVMQKTFNVNGLDRTFKITVRADSPIVVDLPPFTSTAKDPQMARRFSVGGWVKLETPPRSSKLMVPPLSQRRTRLRKRATTTPNVRVFCKSLSFQIEWPKLNGGGNWTWTPTPLTVVAEAVLELTLTQDGPILHVQVLQVKFDPVHPSEVRNQISKMMRQLPHEERVALSECEEKFNDLLVIAMNIAATTYAPKLVYDIHLPVPVVANIPVKPSLLELGDKMVTLGLTVDRSALTARNVSLLQSTLASFEALLSQDIEDAGGLENIVIDGGLVSSGRKRPEEVVFRSAPEIRAKLPRAMSFLRALEKRVIRGQNRRHSEGRDASVPDGLGVGANQDVLTRFARSSMPTPVNKCTDWATMLDVVRGRICWWVHIFDPVVAIAGTSVSGQVSIDIGGEIDACVRKFWDCSWSWDCGNVSLAVKGKPGIKLNLQAGAGISFYGQLIPGGLTLVSNLPWPFNKVIEALSSLVIDAITAVINAIAANIKVDILLNEFALPQQNTKLKFSDISPFAFLRQGSQFTSAEKTFIGFSIGVTAKK